MEINEKVVEKLISKGWKISFAESCTGGLCAGKLVDVANASKVFDKSFVTYANEAKIELLGVDPNTIEKYGVVSEEVAKEMALGLHVKNGIEVGVGVSGIAGPTGGTETKPVGMVCFGFYINGTTFTYTKQFGNIGRNSVREQSVQFVFETLNELI